MLCPFYLLCLYCCIAVIRIQLYTYTCRNKINNNDERTHFFRKIYLSHFILERVARGELDTEQIDPPFPLSLAALFSRSDGLLNRGSWGPIALCWVLVPSTASYFKLTPNSLNLSEAPDYIIVLSTCFLWASHLHPIQPVHSQGYILISSTRCTCSSIDGWVSLRFYYRCTCLPMLPHATIKDYIPTHWIPVSFFPYFAASGLTRVSINHQKLCKFS